MTDLLSELIEREPLEQRSIFQEEFHFLNQKNYPIEEQTMEETTYETEFDPLTKVKSLTFKISNLTKNQLYNALEYKWPHSEDQEIVSSYLDFISNAVSAHPSMIQIISTHLISYFNETNLNIIDRVHLAIQKVNKIVPVSSSIILPLLTFKFPHKTEPLSNQVAYVTHLLKLLDHTPILTESVLTLIFDRVLQIDVMINTEIEELDENEGMVVNDCQEEEIDSSDSESEFEVSRSNIGDMVLKVDGLLLMLFNYIFKVYHNCRNDPDKFSDFFYSLLTIFTKIIIPTHKSRFIQFIYFYITSLDSSFPDIFLGMLFEKAYNVSESRIIRASCISYIGSYLSRSNFIQLESTKTCIQIMSNWAQDFCIKHSKSFNDTRSDRSSKQYTLFYLTIQQLLYIFCFKWKLLLSDADSNIIHGTFPIELRNLSTLLTSKFQPLKVCNPVIVEEFAKVVHHLEIVYCISSKETKSDLGALDAFFPFDPLVLDQCSLFVKHLYIPWDSCFDDDVDDELVFEE